MADDYAVNRFPVMAVYGYRAAKRAGFEDGLAKALGAGIATYYAVLKNVGSGGWGYKPGPREPTLDDALIEREGAGIARYDYIDFGGATFVVDEGRVLGIATLRGEQRGFSPGDYEKQAEKIRRIAPDALHRLVEAIDEKTEQIPGEHFKRGRTFFDLWKQIRDGFRTRRFFGTAR